MTQKKNNIDRRVDVNSSGGHSQGMKALMDRDKEALEALEEERCAGLVWRGKRPLRPTMRPHDDKMII